MASLTTLSTLRFRHTSNLATPNCIVSFFACQSHFLRLFFDQLSFAVLHISQSLHFVQIMSSKRKIYFRRIEAIEFREERIREPQNDSTLQMRFRVRRLRTSHRSSSTDSGGTESSNFITGENSSPFRNPTRNIKSRLFCDDDVFESNGRSTLRPLLRFKTRAAREKKRSSGDGKSEEREMSKADETSNYCPKIGTKKLTMEIITALFVGFYFGCHSTAERFTCTFLAQLWVVLF